MWKQCPLDPLVSQNYYPIENWSPLNSHCVPLSENKCTKIDLRSLKWACGAGVFQMGPFYSLLVAIYKHAKLRALYHNLRAISRSSTCLITSLEHNFPAYREGKKCSCDTVKQCVLTIQLSTVGMSCRKSSQLEDLLMYCDSCCQQFSSTLCSCNFQPSPLHWYRFKSLLTITHTEAAGTINCLFGFWCLTLYESKERCFQNIRAAQLN